MAKRILMFINFFPPSAGGGVYRPLSFVKYLPGQSWNVTVVTPREGEFWITDPGLLDSVPSTVKVVRTGSLSAPRMLNRLRGGGRRTTSRRSSGGFERLRRFGELFFLPDTYIGWIPFAVRAASRLAGTGGFDVVYSTSPPDSTHLAAERVARAFSCPWVADFRDPWIGLRLRTPPSPLHRAQHERMERRVARADRVLVTTSWHERIMREAHPGARIERIPNGYDEDDFSAHEPTAPREGPFTLLHCGMLTLGRSSRPVLEGLRLFLDRSPESAVRVVFLGSRESENEEWVARFGLEDTVAFEDNVPHSECVAREMGSHALLLVKHDDARYRGLVPGKLYEYFGARRPVLAVVPEGEAAELVTRHRRGEVARISDANDIAEKIGKMVTLHREGRLEQAYDLGPLGQYTRKALAARLGEVLEEIIEGK